MKSKTIACCLIAVLELQSCAPMPNSGNGCTQGSSSSSNAVSDKASIALCMAGYAAAGAVSGALLGKVLGNSTKDAKIGAATGAIVAVAASWMYCINKYTRIEHQDIVTANSGAYAGTAGGGTTVTIHDAYIDPATVSPGSKPRLRVLYDVSAPGRDVDVTETVRYNFIGADNKAEHSDPITEQKKYAPGVKKMELDVPVPDGATPGLLQIQVQIAANGVSTGDVKELTISPDLKAAQTATNNAAGDRRKFDAMLASLTSAPSAGGSSMSRATASPADDKGLNRTFHVTKPKANVRDQPDGKAALVTAISSGESYPVVQEKVTNGKWYQIQLPDGRQGWVGGSLGTVSDN